MNKPKQIIAVSLCLLLLVAAAGCGVAAASAVKTAQGNAEVSTMGKTDPKADLPIIGTQESKAPEWDIDGDGRSDNVTVSLLNEHKDNEEAKLTVVLSSQNAPIEKTYFGEWLIRDEWLTYGDINRDGKDEIVLFLMHPNFMGMPNEIHVLSFNDGDLIEINHNRVDSDVYFYGVLETGAIQSAKAITEGDQCLLRVELPWGAMSDGLTQSIDLKWNDSVWEVAKVGEAPVEPEPSDAPARTDSEYQEVYITFFLQEWEDPKGFDVVSPVVSPDNGETYPSIADRAQEALRELFVLTGYQAKDCCVLTDKVGGLMYFAYGPDDFAFSPFLWAYTDTFPYGNNPNRLTKPHGLNIFYNFVGGANKYELIDSASVILPENADAMSEEELVAWYYNRSTMKTGEILKIEHSKSDPNSKMPFYTVYTENDLTFEVHLEYDGVHRPYKLSTLSGPFDLNAEYPG